MIKVIRHAISDHHLFEPLTRDEECDLSRRIASDARDAHVAFEHLVLSHVRIALKIAARYRHLGLPFEDLVNEGCIGLMIAAARFDPRRGTRFFHYAGWWVRKTILKAINEKSTVVRIPDYQRTKMSRDRADRARSRRQTVRARDEAPPSGVPGLLIVSLEDQAGARGRPLRESIHDTETPDPECETLRHERAVALRRAFTCLNTRERFVLTRRYGLAGGGPMTLEQIAGDLGISRERVRQIEKRACTKLREKMNTPKAAAM